MLTRRSFLAAAAAAPLRAQTPKPNVVVIYTDDQRFDTIHALGNQEISTPNMDRLVRQGTSFTHAHIMGGTIGAVCVPSRAMLMTGQTLYHVDRSIARPQLAAPGSQKPFHLFPELFRKSGYDTFCSGKWHNQEELYARCFSSGGPIFFGGMSDQSRVLVSDFQPGGKYPKEKRYIAERYSSEMFGDAAVGFLGSRKAGDAPFLLYTPFTSPHDPRTAPKRFAEMYSPDKVSLPKNFLPQHPFDNGELKVRDELLAPFPRTPEVIRRHLADYYSMVSEVDFQIGRILDAVEKTGQADRTIVVFAGDNGLAVGQHGLMGKQNVYEHSVRVPMIVAGPGVAKNVRNDSLVYIHDIFPTVCRLAGMPVPSTVEGQDLIQAKPRSSVFYGYRDFMRGVRKNDWKLIVTLAGGKRTEQLFDLKKDPMEMTNLASKHPERVSQLLAELQLWQKKTDDVLNAA